MDPELKQKLDQLEVQMVEVQKMTKRMYYFFLTGIVVSILAFVIPLIGLMYELPTFLSTYSTISTLGN